MHAKHSSQHPFPADYVVDRFSFLTDELNYSVEAVGASGREVDILFRRHKVGFRLWYEWAVLPQLFIEVYNSEAAESGEVLHVDWGLLRRFGAEEKVYPVHSRIQRSFFLVGIFVHMTKTEEVRNEVRRRVDEYAEFVEENHDLLVEYAMSHASRAP